jgi:hypothetical protein
MIEKQTYIFFHFNLLDIVAALDIQNSVKVNSGLQLANHEVILGVWLDALDVELSDPW